MIIFPKPITHFWITVKDLDSVESVYNGKIKPCNTYKVVAQYFGDEDSTLNFWVLDETNTPTLVHESFVEGFDDILQNIRVCKPS